MEFERVTLGRTGLSVTRLGIASSYGTNEAMVEEAVDREVNYLYWGALRTRRMGRGIRNVVRRKRDDLVIVAHTTTRSPSTLSKVVEKSLRQLGVDCLDVLLFGWHNKKPDRRLIDRALKLKGEGRIRFLALSGHSRRLFPDLEKLLLWQLKPAAARRLPHSLLQTHAKHFPEMRYCRPYNRL